MAENTTAVLTVTGTDADLPAQTLTYSITGGADQGKFSINGTTGDLTFSAAPDYENPTDADTNNVYVVQVTASDGAGRVTNQMINVTVTPVNESDPVITSANAANVAENTTAVLTVTATDVDLPAQTVTYSITGEADQARFSINATTGELTFTAAPDYENPTDADTNNVYVVQVTASDGAGRSVNQTINVTVTPVNDNDPVITSSNTANVAENTTSVLTVTATDADLPAQTVTYSITGGADQAKFSINGTTGELTFSAAPDYENPTDVDTNNVYVVQVTANDGAGRTANQTINVTVTPINDNDPVITSASAANVAENTTAVLTVTATDADLPAQTITYSITGGADQAKFSINAGTGALTFQAAPDYENPTDADTNNVYVVQVTANDGAGRTASQTINVTVTDLDDTGVSVISDTDAGADYVLENAVVGTTVGITANATDPDATDTVIYSLDDSAGGRFAIDSSTGVITVAGGIDREAAGSFDITVRATSSDTSTTSRTFTITVGDVDEFDVGPVIDTNVPANQVAEDAPVGTAVAITAFATDADATNNTITYSLDDGAGGRFAINSTTGVVTVNAALDYETATSHTITVRATSADGSFTTQTFTINLTDVNEVDVSPGKDVDTGPDPDVPDYSQGPDESIIIADNGDGGFGDMADLVIENIRLRPMQGYETRAEAEETAFPTGENDTANDLNRLKNPAFSHTARDLRVPGSAREFNTLDSRIENPPGLEINVDYDLMRRRIDEFFNSELEENAFRTKVITVAAAAFTVGIVGFLLRAGSLLASLMSTLPLWKGFDPIAVFSRRKKKKKTQNEASEQAEFKGENLFDGEGQ